MRYAYFVAGNRTISFFKKKKKIINREKKIGASITEILYYIVLYDACDI